jgi:hypothetical protein
MLALMLNVVLVITPAPELYCEGPQACAWLKEDGQTGTAFVRGSPPATHVFNLDPGLIHFPHFASHSLVSWRECGEQIGVLAGAEVEYNQAVSLCHEVKHIVHGRSHNQ